MSLSLKKDVKKLLQGLYRDEASKRPGSLLLGKSANDIVGLLLDPLLWLNLLSPGNDGGELEKRSDGLRTILDRKQLLKESDSLLKERFTRVMVPAVSPDKLTPQDELPEVGKLQEFIMALLARECNAGSYILRDGVSITSEAQTAVASAVSSAKLVGGGCGNGERMLGVVIDLYPDSESRDWIGFTILIPKAKEGHENASDRLQATYCFTEASLSLLPAGVTGGVLQIGDTVSFLMDDACFHIVSASMRVEHYLEGRVEEECIRKFLHKVDSLPCEGARALISRVPAYWSSALNEKRIYSLHYKLILAIYRKFHQNSSQPMGLLGTFQRSEFITEILSLLLSDNRLNQPVEQQEGYQEDVETALRLLAALVKHSPASAWRVRTGGCLRHFKDLPDFAVGSGANEIARAVIEAQLDIGSQKPRSSQKDGSKPVCIRDPLFLIVSEYGQIQPTQVESYCHLFRGLEMPEEIVKQREEIARKVEQSQGLISDRGQNSCVRMSKFLTSHCIKWQFYSPSESQCAYTQSDSGAECVALKGIITDVFITGDDSYDGFICRPPKKAISTRREVQIYHFNHTTLFPPKSRDYELHLHIGDVVAFTATNDRVVAITDVIRFFPGSIDKKTAHKYMDCIIQRTPSTLEALCEWPVLFSAILEQRSIYQLANVYTRILAVSSSCIAGCVLNDTTRRLINIFKRGLSFIRAIPFLLTKDSRAAQDPQAYKIDLVAASELLCWAVDNTKALLKAQDVCVPAESLTCLINLLFKHGEQKQLVKLTLSLIGTCIIPEQSTECTTSWRDLSTLLTAREFREGISSKMPSDIPAVKERGRYKSLDEYGSTYYRLLRLDCYGELLQSIGRLKERLNDQQEDTYYRLKFKGIARDSVSNRIVYGFNFITKLPALELGRCGSEDDIQSLKEGNLMCLSATGKFGDHEEVIWATLCKASNISKRLTRNDTTLKQGKMYMELCFDINEKDDEDIAEELKRSENIVAVESPAFFRAYRPVLEALKKMDLEKVHFRDDLLNPTREIQSKLELLNDDVDIDPSPLYKEPRGRMKVGDLKKALHDSTIDDQFCLDSTQRDAIHHILSQSLTLIKGPPGTGKTYIGVKALQVLLTLSSLSQYNCGPVIVMAYRNRALDHFLEMCTSFCPVEDIIRVGGRNTEDYNDFVRKTHFIRRIDSDIRNGFYIQKLQYLYEEVQRAAELLRKRSSLSPENCWRFMPPKWLQSLLLQVPSEHKENICVPAHLERRVKSTPKSCLKHVKCGMMGERDDSRNKQLVEVLEKVWSVWTSDVDIEKAAEAFPKNDNSEIYSDTEEEEEEEGEECVREMDDVEQEIGLEKDIFDVEDDSQVTAPVTDSDVWKLSPEEKKQLMYDAAYQGYEEAMENMKRKMKDYNTELKNYESKRRSALLQILRNAKIVGFTTTQAATFQEILNKLNSQLVFVEEAAEVLESNLLATLTPHVKHLVLIGDDNQLRPKVSYRELIIRHANFNVSMFERLIKNGFPHAFLAVQGRMHPSLTCLYSYHYEDHCEIESSKDLKLEELTHPTCMAEPYFWWTYPRTHNIVEGRNAGTSICNKHEAEMVVSLYTWLQANGECTENITVLTPYQYQCMYIQQKLSEKYPKVRVFTLDNFQGHESAIVILSLVRLNPSARLGIVSDQNRQVVATSRQQRALYIVGNAEFLKDNSPCYWKPFIEKTMAKHCSESLPVVLATSCKMKKVQSASELLQLASQYKEYCDGQAGVRRAATDPAVQAQQSSVYGIQKQQSCPPALMREPSSKFIALFVELSNHTDGVTKNWELIGHALGVGDCDIEALQRDHHGDCKEACYRMFVTWEMRKGREATTKALIDGLLKVGLKNATEVVERHSP